MKKSNNFKGYFNLDTIIFICFFELFFSGERQLLLTLWGGRGHNIAYASKAHIELQKSGLCIGGFTQPDRMMEIIEEMKASSDGLFDRFLSTMESIYPVIYILKLAFHFKLQFSYSVPSFCGLLTLIMKQLTAF